MASLREVAVRLLSVSKMMDYEEFSFLRENAREVGIPWREPVVARDRVQVRDGRHLSMITWGKAAPELVLIHGGGQNAHTWDSVALALDLPLVALDLPGHGHSDWVEEPSGLRPKEMAKDVAIAIRQVAPTARVVVGMSLGGFASIALADDAPDLVRRLAIVDVTPGVGERPMSNVARFLQGPREFETFEDLLHYTLANLPPRPIAATRRGLLHNSRQREDGTWTWRHQARGGRREPAERLELWNMVGRIRVPTILFRGSRSPIVSDADVAEFCARLPSAAVVVVEGAGHSIQGDQPVLLAGHLRRFVLDAPLP